MGVFGATTAVAIAAAVLVDLLGVRDGSACSCGLEPVLSSDESEAFSTSPSVSAKF